MRIGELCSYAPKSTIKAGEAVDGAKYMFFTSSADESKRYTEYQYDGEGIIMGTGGNATLHYYSGKYAVSTDCLVLVPRGNIRCKYLYYYLKANMTVLEAGFKGAGLKHTNKKYISDIDVNTVPDFCKQDEIIAILDKLNAVINSRKQELQLLEDLVSARFVEMFGAVEQNPFEWDMSSVGKLISSCEAGWSGNGTQRAKRDGEIAVLRVSAVTKGYFIPDECKVLDDQSTIKKYVYPEKGDLLFSRANTREMVGATAVITRDYPEYILPDKLWKIRFTDTVNVWYMKYVLSSESIRSIFSSVSTGTSGSMFNVSMEKFKAIMIPLPPIELQEQFADFVKGLGKSKLMQQYIYNIFI